MRAPPPDSAAGPSDERWLEQLTRGWREPGDLQAALDRVAETARDAFAADLSTVFALNPVTRRFAAEIGTAGEFLSPQGAPHRVKPREQGLTRRVIDEGYLTVTDISQLPAEDSSFCHSEGISCFAAVALHTVRYGRPFAVLYVDYRRRRAFDERFRRRLLRFAELASRELQNTRLLYRYQRVREIGQEINRRRRSDRELFQDLWQSVRQIIDTSRCFVWAVFRPEDHSLDLFARIEGRERIERRPPAGEPVQWLLRNPLQISARSDASPRILGRIDRLPGNLPWEAESALFVPLEMEKTRRLGILSVQHPAPDAFDDEDRHLLGLLANHLALAQSNLRLFRHLHGLQETGQHLLRELESETVLQTIVDSIRESSGCDLAILYPYFQSSDAFELPPRHSGVLEDEEAALRECGRPRLAAAVLQQQEPRFESRARDLYAGDGSGGEVPGGRFQSREKIRSAAVLPLRVGDEPVGVLFVNYRKLQRFEDDPALRDLLEGLAGYAAIAIKNSRELGAERHRYVKTLEALRDFDRQLNRSNDLEELLGKIPALIREQLGDRVDEVAVLLYDEEQHALVPEAAFGAHPEEIYKQKFRVGKDRGLTLEVLEEGETILAPDVRDPEWEGRWMDIGVGTRCELDVPLIDGDEVVGVLNLESRTPRAFDPADVQLIETLAGQAVLAVQKAKEFDEKVRALREERRLGKDKEALVELAKELTRSLDVDQLLALILQKAVEETRADAGVLVLVDPKQGDLIVRAELPRPMPRLGRRLPSGQGILGRVLETGEKVNAPDVHAAPWRGIYVDVVPGTRSELAWPLKRGEEVIGVLDVESTQPAFFSPRNERLLAGLADLAVIALLGAERFEAAEERQRQLEALDDLGRKVVAQVGDPDQVLHAIVEHALRLTGATEADVDLYEAGKWAALFQARKGRGKKVRTAKLDLRAPGVEGPPQGLIRKVVRERKPWLVPGNAAQQPGYEGDPKIRSELLMPLGSGDEFYGVLDVRSRKLDAFDRHHLEILTRFVSLAVIAIKNSQSYETAERRLRRFEVLHKAGEELAQITDLDDLERAYEIVVRKAHEQFGSEVVVRRLDLGAGGFRLARSTGISDPSPYGIIPLDDPLAGKVRDEGTIYIPDALDPPPDIGQFPRSNDDDRAFLVTSIAFERHYYGNLALSHAEADHFRQADRELVKGLAQQLAITIHRLEEAKARQEAELRAVESEKMGEVGRQTFELMHRLGNDLGLVPDSMDRIHDLLEAQGQLSEEIETEIGESRGDVKRVLDLSKKLGNEIKLSDEQAKVTLPALGAHPLAELVEQAVSSLRLDEEKRRSIRIEVKEIDRRLKVAVDFDPFIDALLNLLRNAVEAMPEGGELSVGGAGGDRMVDLWIQDTGRGIHPGDLPRLFDLGYTTKAESSGFGLWSVKRTIVSHDGKISAESERGKGTRFTIQLPRAEERTDA